MLRQFKTFSRLFGLDTDEQLLLLPNILKGDVTNFFQDTVRGKAASFDEACQLIEENFNDYASKAAT